MSRAHWDGRLDDLPDEWERRINAAPDGPGDPGYKRHGNGVYQGRNGLREPKPAPSLGWWRDKVFDLQPLCEEVFPSLKYAVPGLIPEGVTLLAGRPKLGKSWLLLQIACAIARGDITLTTDDEPAPYGNVLYLALEDNKRRMQHRVTRYYGAHIDNWPSNFQYVLEWLRLDEGGVDGLGEWCFDVKKPRLIVIDTLQRVRPPKGFGQTDYEADMAAAEGLVRLCRDHPGLSIICAHHDRKQDAGDVFDTVSGTLGLQGGVDTIAILKRAGGGVTLHIKGRDLIEEIEKAVNFDRETCRWHILGEAAEVHQSDTRKAILELLKTSGTLTARQLADQMETLTLAGAKTALWRMARDGLLENDRGTFRETLKPGETGQVKPQEVFDM